jgi:peptidyl-dipeptidase Dcp
MTQNTRKNPIVAAFEKHSWGTFDESIAFSQIQIHDFIPAVDKGVEIARENIRKIKENPDAPTFENTMLALESASELLEIASGVYFNLFSAEASPELQALAKEISPKSAAFSSEVSLDSDLFAKIRFLYDNLKNSKLDDEQKMLVDKTYRSFVKNGALLSPEQKKKITKIDQELSLLGPQFSENVLKATNNFELWITDKKDLEGLPESAIEGAAQEAGRKAQTESWLFTLQAPSFMPFMQYSKNRELRKKMWSAFSSRAYQGEASNQQVVLDLVRLRDERAKIMGYKNHAEITLTERMAETPHRVFEFLNELLIPSKTAAEKDLQELKDFALSTDNMKDLMPWDFAYYSEKLKEQKFKFSEEELRPYFKLENVVQGVFAHAKKLYGLRFEKLAAGEIVPKYNPEVETYKVTDSKNNYVGLFYTDFFPRETKRDGAWMTTFRDQGFFMGKVRRPHVSIVCNFTKPTPSKPSLLTYDEVLTLFHEFGHALHGLLSQCNYRSLSGTNVYWDFVELPSQIMENWVKEKAGLDVFAKHYETDETIPPELVEKIKKSNQFQAGYYSLRQISFALLDMAWYTANPASIKNVADFERTATENTRLFPILEGVNQSCAFSHIFAGGYSAGYYSYKWAEVLDADAFEFFKEKGIFDPEVAHLFRDNILARGGTEHPMQLYKKFRGREPDPKALLRRDGLL